MHSFTIKDLENLSGIKAHTIRIWEQRYSFLKPSRSDTNIRYYSNEELKKLLNIALLNKYGYKISHIDKMNEAELQEKLLTLTQTQAQQERLLNDLIQYMVDFDMEKFEILLDSCILAKGIERTVNQIIFPFLEKIGILWLTNHINPAQEHLVTNIIRQKLILGIEQINGVLQKNKTILLFLPEGEYHELGLLFMNFLLKSRGVKTIYLGASVPIADMVQLVKQKKPDYLYAHLTSVGHKFNFEKFINQATVKFPPTSLVISGQIVHSGTTKMPSTVILKRSFAEVMEFIYSL
ncbi:MAG: MerR family transcriptional regulator [Chitinophagaceae bacterium]|nr:MAG: MerR family transcriptional regulator [Chitinophagaceae bacterium]